MTSEIKIGCWINTPYGQAVLVAAEEKWVGFRYSAIRYSDGAPIWVLNGCGPDEISYLGPPDEETAEVLKLEGPYGEGWKKDMLYLGNAFKD